jgi:serine/threonine-protein kinase RsbW
MGQNNWIWRSDHLIGSDINAGRRVLDELLGQLRSHRWDHRDVFGVHLAMEEALVNAIRHGNREDPRKRVEVHCRLAENKVKVEIADEGPGFDANQVPDPTDAKHRELPAGRGLLLMRTFMSRVTYEDQGRKVILEKDRNGKVPGPGAE